ncbi:MAG: NADH-quinone oxidoreductase subunit L [Peptococcaceae bacterium]|nr:NADH-quinone oxidoreductase subunit L [Peptococcaceae bacterium]
MELVLFLIIVPIIVGVALLFIPARLHTARKSVVAAATLVLSGVSIYLVTQYIGEDQQMFSFDAHVWDMVIVGIEMILAGFIIVLSIIKKQYLAAALMLVGAGLMCWFEFAWAGDIPVRNVLFVDNLSLIMSLIIGVIGCLIALFAVGYMKTYHEKHPDVKDRTGFFFFIIFAFMGAMYGVVFANSLVWLFFFWEITTLCSFFLIGYSRQKTAVKNAFRALKMNLLGGIGFAVAIILLAQNTGTIELDHISTLSSVALLPMGLLAFAGLTKAAQMPFSSWLLGAMVAPTPVSALLHSSAMVKAGVYLIIRLSPAFDAVEGGGIVGLCVALVGAVTFVLTSFMAISQKDAKRVLAYSTVANLGLIVVCAGMGNYLLAWAAVMLVIFHAVAKSLLFLSVGTVEHNLGDRSIESMDGLIRSMPKVAVGMAIGILGMFLAPFGMLISKWAALEGLVEANAFLTVFVAFGGAATLFFWSKWLGKIIMVKAVPEGFVPKVSNLEKVTLGVLAGSTVLVCLTFPLISQYFLEPFILGTYGEIYVLEPSNVGILLMMMGLMIVLPLSLLTYRKVGYREQYLAGANVDEKEKFRGSLGVTQSISVQSFYLDSIFGEKRLFNIGVIFAIALILIMLVFAALRAGVGA